MDTIEINDDEINVEDIMKRIRENIKRRKESGEYSEADEKQLYEQAENCDFLYGWHDAEDWNGTPTRWMGDDAILVINSDRAKTVDLCFQATSFRRSRGLKISDGNLQDVLQTVPTALTLIKVPISLKEGPNIIRFKIPEGGERPCDIPEMNSEDGRCLSIAVQSITVQNGSGEAKPTPASSSGSNIEPLVFTPEVIDVSSTKRYLQEINSKWDIENNSYTIASNRPVTGKFLIKGRELVHGEVRRYVDPMIWKQKEFNTGVVNSLTDTIQKIDILAQRLLELGKACGQIKADVETEVNQRVDEARAEIVKEIESSISRVRQDVDAAILKARDEAQSAVVSQKELINSTTDEKITADIATAKEEINDSISNVRSEILNELSKQTAQVKADALEEMKKRISQISLEISKDLGKSISRVKQESHGELNKSVAQAKLDIERNLSYRFNETKSEIIQDTSSRIDSTKAEIDEKIKGSAAQIKAEASEDIKNSIGQVRAEISEEIKGGVSQAKAEIDGGISGRLGQTKAEVVGELGEVIAGVKGELIADFGSRISQSRAETVEEVKGYISQTDANIRSDVGGLVSQVKAEIAGDVDGRFANANAEIDQGVINHLGQARTEISSEINDKFTQARGEVSGEITDRLNQAKSELVADFNGRIGQTKAETIEEVKGYISQSSADIKNDIIGNIAQAKSDILGDVDGRFANAKAEIDQGVINHLGQARTEISGEINSSIASSIAQAKTEIASQLNQSKADMGTALDGRIAQVKAEVLGEVDGRVANVKAEVGQNTTNALSQARSEMGTELANQVSQAKNETSHSFAGQIGDLRSEIDRRIDERVKDIVASMDDDLDKKAWLARVLHKRLETVKDLSVSVGSNDTGINYFVFEERFRGPRKEIKQRQSSFLEYFKGCKDVLDIGCGRGEFLELLKENGIEGQGVDIEEDMVNYSRSRGLKVTHTDAVSFLEGLADKSLDGIFLGQVVEHLEPVYLVKMLELCYRKLNYGYYIVIETVNPLSFASFANFYIDMTHKRPMHPETLNYLLKSVDFRETDVKFFSPIPDDQKLKRIVIGNDSNTGKETSDTLNYNIDLLNNILYGSQDYMVCGKK